jgi:hypothetical protein
LQESTLTAAPFERTIFVMNVRFVRLLLLFIVPTVASAQSADKSAVNMSFPDRVLRLSGENLCTVDFANSRVYGENKGWTARLRNGKYERKSGFFYEWAKLDHVYCFHDGRRALLVTLWMDCGGSCTNIGVAQLVSIRNGHPIITQQFAFDSDAQGTGVSFDEDSLTLVITGRSDDHSPHCCPKSLDVVEYHWKGEVFVQAKLTRRSPNSTATSSDRSPKS